MRLILSQIQVAGQILAQDDSDEDESGDDNLGLDFFRFLMLFFTSRVNMYTVLLIKVYESYIIV